MSIYLLIQAVEALDDAVDLTIDQKERDEITHASLAVRTILQRRGVFVGNGEPKPLSPGHSHQISATH